MINLQQQQTFIDAVIAISNGQEVGSWPSRIGALRMCCLTIYVRRFFVHDEASLDWTRVFDVLTRRVERDYLDPSSTGSLDAGEQQEVSELVKEGLSRMTLAEASDELSSLQATLERMLENANIRIAASIARSEIDTNSGDSESTSEGSTSEDSTSEDDPSRQSQDVVESLSGASIGGSMDNIPA